MLDPSTPLLFPSLGPLYQALAPWAEALLRVSCGLALVPPKARRACTDSCAALQVLVCIHVVIAKPLHTFARLFASVQPFTQLLAGLEERHPFLLDLDGFAGTRIAPGAGGAVFHGKSAEAAQLDPVATRQGGHDLIEDRVHDVLHVPLVEMRVVLGDALNEFGFDHRNWDPGTCGCPFP